MEMNIYQVVHYMFPDITDDDFLVVDHSDGNGPHIHYWYYQNAPQPTQEELEAAWAELQEQTTVDTTPLTLEQQIAFANQTNDDQNMMIEMLAQATFQ